MAVAGVIRAAGNVCWHIAFSHVTDRLSGSHGLVSAYDASDDVLALYAGMIGLPSLFGSDKRNDPDPPTPGAPVREEDTPP